MRITDLECQQRRPLFRITGLLCNVRPSVMDICHSLGFPYKVVGQMRNGGQSEKLYGKCETRMEHAIRHFHYETDGKQDRIAELKAQRKTMDKQLEDMRSRRGKPTT